MPRRLPVARPTLSSRFRPGRTPSWVQLLSISFLALVLAGCGAGSAFLPPDLPGPGGGGFGLRILSSDLVDGVAGRSYTNLIDTAGGRPPLSNCTVQLGSLPAGLSLTPTDTTCTISGTISAAATGSFTFTLLAIDSSGRTATEDFTIVVRPEFDVTAFQVVDAIANRSYSKTFVVLTNLDNDPDPDELGSTEAGNGPITACAIAPAGLPAGMTATCVPAANGISMEVALTAPDATLVPGGPFALTLSVSDTDIQQSGNTVVPLATTLTNATQPDPFAVSISVRNDFDAADLLTPVSLDTVDAIQGRAYSRTLPFTTALEDNGDDVPNDVGTGEEGNGPIAACAVSGLPADFNVTCALNPDGVSGTITISTPTVVTSAPAANIPLTLELFDSPIPQASPLQVGPVVPASSVTLDFIGGLTIREEFSITEPLLVDAVEGRDYTKTIDTTLEDADLGDLGSVEIGNGPAALCEETTGNLAAIGLSIAPDPNDASNCLIEGTVTSGGGTTINITIAVTDEDINQAPQGTPVVDAATLTRDYSLVVRAETTFSNTTVVDAVTGRSYTHSIVTDRDLPNPTGGDGPITCALTGSPPTGLDVQVAANGLDCELFTPTVITDAAGTYNFTVEVTDADILQDAATVVAGATVSQVYTLRVRDEFDFLTAAVVDGVAGRAYSKLVETDLVDIAGLDDIDEVELGNGPVAANGCGISTSGAGPFTSFIVVPVLGGDITLSVAPDATLPAPSACRLTATIPVTITGGEFVEFFIQATDNAVPFTNPRTAGVETVVPAQPIVSGMLTLTVRDDTQIDLAGSNCTLAGVCPAAVKDRTYTNTLMQTGGTGGDPPRQWNVTAGSFTLAAGVWTGTGGTTCEALTIDQVTGDVDGTPTGATAGNCAFTITLEDAGIKQATDADHGATLAGAMLEVVPTGASSEALSIDVRLEMTIANASLPGGLKSSTYNATLSAINGLTTAGEVGLPAVLTWSEPSGLLGAGACTGLALVDPDATSADNTATIEGTPTTAGTCGPLTLRAADDGNAPGTGNFVPAGFAETILTIVINDALGFVTNFTGGDVRVIDTDADVATANTVALTGGATPRGIALNPKDPLFGYVANGPTGIGDVQVFCTRVDATAGCPAAFTGPGGVPFSLGFPGVSVDPRDVAVYPTGDFGLVVDPASPPCAPFGAVFVFDTATQAITGSLNCIFGATFAESIAIRPQGDRAYVTTGNDTLVEFVLFGPFAFFSSSLTIPVAGTTTLDIAISPDGRFAYVTDSTNSRVHVIDLTLGIYVASTPAPGAAGGLMGGAVLQFIAFAPDGRYAYVTDIGNDVVAAIDPATLNLGAGTVAVTNNNIALATGLDPFGIAVTDNVLKAFVANNGTASVSVIDTDATPSATFQTEIASFDGAANFSGPYGVATMPNPSLHIVNPLPAGIEGRAYDFSVIAVGGTRPYTFSVDPLDLPLGLSMDANGLITGTPDASSGSPAGTAYPFDVTVVDSSNPTQSHTRTLSITIFDTTALAVGNPPDGVDGRTYTFNLDASGGALPVFWSDGGTLAADVDCNGLSLAANGVLSGTTGIADNAVCGFTATVNDASGPIGAGFPTTVTIRQEFSTTAFAVVDAIAQRAYSNTLVVFTNLSNNLTEAGQPGEFGNGPITACSVIDLLAIGVTATCVPDGSGTAMMVTLSAPTATLVAPGTTFRIQVTDSPIGTAVPANTQLNNTQPSPFVVALTVRDEFTVGPITDPVDAVEGRTYTNAVTIPSDLENNPVASEVSSIENGNGPVTGCVVLDSGTALTNFNGTSNGTLVRGLTVTCTGFSFGATSAVVNFSGTVTTAAQQTKVLTVRLFDTIIQQNASTVVALPGDVVAGNAFIFDTFNLTFRDEFGITSTPPLQADVPDAVDGDVYTFTFTVDTNLSNNGVDVGQVAELGNGPLLPEPGVTGGTGCEVTGLPAGFQYGYTRIIGGAGGAQTLTKCEITISAVTTVPTAAIGTHPLSVTVRDTTIGAVVPSGAIPQAQFDLVVTSAALTFTVSAVNSGALTACSLGTLVDPGAGGTLPTTADAVRNRTYGPGRCDLLFTVAGGKKPFTWFIVDDALGGMTCTVVTFPAGGTGRSFRCQRTTVVPDTHPLGGDTFTVKACDKDSTVVDACNITATPIFASTTRIITVRDQLTIERNFDPIPDAVIGRPFGAIGVLVATLDLLYSVPTGTDGAGLAPLTLTGTFAGTGITCATEAAGAGESARIACDSDDGDDTLEVTTDVVLAGTTSGTVTASDTANLTTPAATDASDPGRKLIAETIVANDELTLTNTVLVNGLLNRAYAQELEAEGGLDNATFDRTFEKATGVFPSATPAIAITNDPDSDLAVAPTLTGRISTSGALDTASASAADFTFSLRARDQGNSTTLSCEEMDTMTGGVFTETCADRNFIVNVLGEHGYIANSDDAANNVVRFDAATLPATTSIISMDTDGPRAENPNIVGVTPNARFAWVTKPGDTHDLSAIDTITNLGTPSLARESLAVGPACVPPACDADNFPTSLSGTPQEFDSAGAGAAATVGAGPASAAALPFDVWFTNMDSGVLQKIDGAEAPATAALGATFTGTGTTADCSTDPASTRFAGVAITSDGQFAVFSNPCDGDVTRADLVGATTSDIPFGDPPGNVASDPRGKFIYVNNLNDADADGVPDAEGSIGVIDVAAGTVAATIPLALADGRSCTRPAGLAASPDGNRLFVTCPADGLTSKLVMLDVSDPLLGATFGDPLAGTPFNLNATAGDCVFPLGIRFNPEGTRAYIACRVSDTILVLNTSAQPPTIVDANGATAGNAIANSSPSGAVGLDIIPNPVLHITTSALPDATITSPYLGIIVGRGGIRVNGGTRDYTFTTDGAGAAALAAQGLVLNPDGSITDTGGVVAGPAASLAISVTVTDNAVPQQTATKTVTLEVVP